MADQVKLALDAKNIVGESIVWDDRSGMLYWVDIIAREIHGLAPETSYTQCWKAPSIATSIGLRKDGGAIVGLEKEVALWDFGSAFKTLAVIEPDLPGNRLNEGVVGPDGAFWVGTMQNNINPDGSPKDITESAGRLYRVTADGKVTALSDDRFGITNTMVWTEDNRLVTADTLQNALFSYARDPQTGKLSDRTTILKGFERGLPDGSCVDAEGYIWNCRVVGGGCVIRMDDSGKIDRIVDLRCSWPTSCTFGGKNLDRLFITSARFTMSDEHLAANPHEGGLFEVDAGVVGCPSNRFG